MQDFSMSDAIWIFGSLIVFAAVMRYRIEMWRAVQAIVQLACAARRRYVHTSWSDLLTLIEDEGVNSFEDAAASLPSPEPVQKAVRTGGMDTDTYHLGPAANTSVKNQAQAPQGDVISRKMSDTEVIVVLAVQRRPDGNYRFSSNRIAHLIGGTRNEVLDQIRAIRGASSVAAVSPNRQSSSPQYRPLTPDSRPALD
jgi:hypothetical protein